MGGSKINTQLRQTGFGGVLLLVLALAAGCAIIAPERPEWPDNLPPRSYYDSHYAADRYNQQFQSRQEYLLWVQRFYTGWAGVPGWHSIREEILADVDPADRPYIREAMDDLGRRIAGEWAKESDRRVIVNKTLQAWINAAYEAAAHGDHRRLVQQISRDVDALLAGDIRPSLITLNRYYPDAEEPPSVGAMKQDAGS